MDPDQTTQFEQVTCKTIQQSINQTIFVVIGTFRVKRLKTSGTCKEQNLNGFPQQGTLSTTQNE